MFRGLLDKLRERGTPTTCPSCGGPLINMGPLGLYCSSCGSVMENLPKSGTFTVIGEPGSGKTVFLYKVISHLLKQARPSILIACDQGPERIRQSIKDLGYPMYIMGNWGSNQFADFTIIDAFSGTTGLRSSEEYAVEGVYDLNEMSINLSSVCDRMKNQSFGVFLDSANPLFMHRDGDSVMRFLHLCGSRVAAKDGSFYFTLTLGVVEESVQRKLESIVDGIFEMRILEERGRPMRQMRVKKMRGKKMLEDWVTFEIVPGTGMVGKPIV